MLDTDSVSYALRGHGNVRDRILSHRPSALCISAITVAELRYGAQKRKSRRLHSLIDTFTGDMNIVPFDKDAANRYGRLAASLAAKGAPIGTADTMIAASALSQEFVLVTNNIEYFRRIRGLKLENWV